MTNQQGVIVAHDVDGRWTLDPMSREDLLEALDACELQETELRTALISEPGVIFVVASPKGMTFEVCPPVTDEDEDESTLADAREISAWLRREDRVLVLEKRAEPAFPRRADLISALVETGGARIASKLRGKGRAYVLRDGQVRCV